MFPRARCDTPILALFVSFVVVSAPAGAQSHTVPRDERNANGSVLADHATHSHADRILRPDRPTPPLRLPAPSTALRPVACSPKLVALFADGERTHRVSLGRDDVTSYVSRFHSVRNGGEDTQKGYGPNGGPEHFAYSRIM